MFAAAVVDGVIYAIGGETGVFETKNEAYDPGANTWTIMADMPTGRRYLAAAAVDGVIYAIGGWTGDLEAKNEAYDPTSNTWYSQVEMPTGRCCLAAVTVDGVIFAIGGYSPSAVHATNNDAFLPSLYVYTKD